MPSSEKSVQNKLGKRFSWQPAHSETPAEAAIGRLTASAGASEKQTPEEKLPELPFAEIKPVEAHVDSSSAPAAAAAAPQVQGLSELADEERPAIESYLSPPPMAAAPPVPVVMPSAAAPEPANSGPPTPTEKAELVHKLKAEVSDLRWWAFLSTMVCLLVLFSWLV